MLNIYLFFEFKFIKVSKAQAYFFNDQVTTNPIAAPINADNKASNPT